MKNKEYLKGLLDAKIAAFITETDYQTFANLKDGERLSFFINNNLVTTNIITNFEALTLQAIRDLKNEAISYLEGDLLYIYYFFKKDYVPKVLGADVTYYKYIYEEGKKSHDEAFLSYLDLVLSLRNVMNLLRLKKRGDDKDKIVNAYLYQQAMSYEVYTTLVDGDPENIITYLKQTYNLDVDPQATNTEIEDKIDTYINEKIKDFALESDVHATLIYYLHMRIDQLFRLRTIYYTKRDKAWKN